MKNTIIKYGLYSFVTASILFLLSLLLANRLSYGGQEIIGYASMAISLVFIFFGIRQYRDKENGGVISFSKALLIGVLISLFAAVGFGIVDYMYTTMINPDFVDEYLAVTLSSLKETVSSIEYEEQKKLLEQQMMDYGKPHFMALLMFATVLIMGFVFSLISGLILQKK